MAGVISGTLVDPDRESGRAQLSRRPRLLRKLLSRYRKLSRRLQRAFILGFLSLILFISLLVWIEAKSSVLASLYFSRLVKQLSFNLGTGASDKIHFPVTGPYDIKMGYTKIAAATQTLKDRGFIIGAQAVMSDRMLSLAQSGIFPTYKSKLNAGLVLNDRNSNVMFSVLRPERLYPTFNSIPQLVLDALLFIENKEVLNEQYPFKNPAIEWDRFFLATVSNLYEIFDRSHSAPGGSTIATQLEKYQHSPEGRTHSVGDKLRQMFSASLRSYQNGRDTRKTRQQIIHTYINSIPLAAFPGYGEVNGVGDGLWAWFATDFDSCNQILANYNSQNPHADAGLCFRKVLSLFVAHRRPSFYLIRGRQQLGSLVNSYIRLMAKSNSIPQELANAALTARIFYRGGTIDSQAASFVDRKAVNAIRKNLSTILSVPKMYDLDHMDLTVKSTIDKASHDAVTATLQSLNNPKVVKDLGLMQSRLLIKGDPSKVTYSLTLFERTPEANLLRIQTDNFDGPFDINSGTRLDLGSTAKLRTLVTYLEIIENLHTNLSKLEPAQRNSKRTKKTDPIGNWAIDTLNSNPGISLKDFLDKSMARTYSANPGEAFFTAGGLHYFNNFKKEDNSKVVSLTEALRESINLPFIRLMRDIVRFYSARPSATPGQIQLGNNKQEEEAIRQAYLVKFADKEGREFLNSFYAEYKALPQQEREKRFFSKIKPVPARIAAAYRFIYPEHDQQALGNKLKLLLPSKSFSAAEISALYERYGKEKFDLNDRGYIVKLHPLELWLVADLMQNPERPLKDIFVLSQNERQLIYKWLFKPSKRGAQDVRIKRLLEEDAFLPIFNSWKKTGYPFSSMVPSYASSIGSSGDRPSALAELMGIILNDGVKLPQSSIEQLHFAKATPYETIFARNPVALNERVFSPEVAQVLRSALTNVVENGTARRLKGTIKSKNGSIIPVGGKTGTGDAQFKQFAPGGRLVSSRVVSRTATFVFFIGDRFFGTVSAHVAGEKAGDYEFTSALAAEVLKASAPALSGLIN